MKNNWNSHMLLVGIQEFSLQNSLTVSYKGQYSPAIPLSNSNPSSLPKRNESNFPQGDFIRKCLQQLYL